MFLRIVEGGPGVTWHRITVWEVRQDPQAWLLRGTTGVIRVFAVGVGQCGEQSPPPGPAAGLQGFWPTQRCPCPPAGPPTPAGEGPRVRALGGPGPSAPQVGPSLHLERQAGRPGARGAFNALTLEPSPAPCLLLSRPEGPTRLLSATAFQREASPVPGDLHLLFVTQTNAGVVTWAAVYFSQSFTKLISKQSHCNGSAIVG